MDGVPLGSQVLWFGEWRKSSMKDLPLLMLPRLMEIVKDPSTCYSPPREQNSTLSRGASMLLRLSMFHPVWAALA